ncbi:hypothetical protein HK100_003197 [Physocladia obscura]|uniref:Uncharacterized protein n=1 Tax=Physocladia obscura TaxID=109957 RepID=A0AAD5XEV3_9FUNG|nr:hypothetical protein HK100_003197 [Physocladia obscura]
MESPVFGPSRKLIPTVLADFGGEFFKSYRLKLLIANAVVHIGLQAWFSAWLSAVKQSGGIPLKTAGKGKGSNKNAEKKKQE